VTVVGVSVKNVDGSTDGIGLTEGKSDGAIEGARVAMVLGK